MNNFLKDHLNQIKKNNFLYPELELRTLIKYCSNNQEAALVNNFSISKLNINKFQSAFKRRMNFEPISKIFNKKEFWSLDFYVDKFVLDPRPESEFLIQTINDYYTDSNLNIKICDLGTGSGCLAIILAKIYKKSKITAIDISNDAIKVAKKNAKLHYVEKQIKFVNCDWSSLNETFDLVVSNPPYLSYSEYKESDINIRKFEPKVALLGGCDGLNSYREISKIAPFILYSNSFLFVEIGKSQTSDIKKILENHNLKLIKIIKDYQQINRVLVIKNV